MKHYSKIALAAMTLAMSSTTTWAQGLKDVYKDYFMIGVAVNQRNVTNPEQMALIKKEFNSMTAENDMKPEPTEPQEGKFNWENADRIADFARQNGIKLRGHCLMWHSQIGRWMLGDNPTKEVFYQRMKNHIQAVVTRYKDIVYCWDVVNEAIDDNANATDPYRQSPMYRLCGDEFIEKAFQYAREADPDALLYYNDYSTVDPHKRDRIYNMVKKMKDKGVPIDGIGMQGHYNIYFPSENLIDQAITKFKTIVKHIQITEFDIRINEEMGGGLQFSREGANVTDSVKQHLADQYARCFSVFRKHKDVIDCVTFWNLSDRDSWLGAANYPLPWDTEYKPKLAYEYIKDMKAPKWELPARPPRSPQGQQGQRRRGGDRSTVAPTTPTTATAQDSTMISNPMLWADTPDPDVIRVGDTFYLVTTTMHLMPGAPVMASKDLKNWETVGYIFDRLTDSPKYDLQEGTVYGRGQWATSLKYHDGRFWALLAPNEDGPMGDTYIFTAPKAEGPWTIHARLRHFHDATLFFDDDGTPYVFFGTGEMCQLTRDLKGVVEGSLRHYFEREADERGLLEGTRVVKHNGTYYAQLISHVFAPGRHRREVCYRTKDLNGTWEKNVILESDFGGFSYLAQGTIVDTEEGDWYGIMFQDRGGVGRVLTLSPVRWIDGWPMLGDERGKVPDVVRPYRSGQPKKEIVCADEFDTTTLGLHWQWNHNPVDAAWSLSERHGFLRLKTSRVVPNLYLAPNTLTQRMFGPTCSGAVCIDFSKMKDGDCAGFCAFNGDSGVLTLKKSGKSVVLEMSEQKVSLTDREKAVANVDDKLVEGVSLTKMAPKARQVWLRIDGDFRPGHNDAANFYYSLDGQEWKQIGTRNYRCIFDYRRFFMGSKFAVFNYATKKAGGYIDVDEFKLL